MTAKRVTVTTHISTPTLGALTTGITLAHLFHGDSNILKREVDAVNQLPVTPERVGLLIHIDEQVVEGDQLFCFTGRRPTLDGLGLEYTTLDPSGDWVNDKMQARDDEYVFVPGDVNGREPILYVAKEQALQAAENILAHARRGTLQPYENISHYVIFSALGVYPFARVGHTERSAREAGYDVAVASRQASDDGVFKTMDVPA